MGNSDTNLAIESSCRGFKIGDLVLYSNEGLSGLVQKVSSQNTATVLWNKNREFLTSEIGFIADEAVIKLIGNCWYIFSSEVFVPWYHKNWYEETLNQAVKELAKEIDEQIIKDLENKFDF